MATRDYVQNRTPHDADGVRSITWTGLLNGDDGEAYVQAGYPDRSVQVFGTYGTGGSITIEGANDPALTNWVTLHDAQGVSLTFPTPAKIAVVAEHTYAIRPRVPAGDGTTNLTCVLLATAG
jgi:hypothetical protein